MAGRKLTVVEAAQFKEQAWKAYCRATAANASEPNGMARAMGNNQLLKDYRWLCDFITENSHDH